MPKFIHIDINDSSSVAEGLTILAGVVLPWDNDGSSPARPHRTTALGVRLGQVDPGLGGFQWGHDAAKNGRWGFRASVGSRCVFGIANTLEEAQAEIDAFLLKEGLRVLEPKLLVGQAQNSSKTEL